MITVFRGHVINILKQMIAGSVHTIITSPPYWGLRDYGLPALDWSSVLFRPMAGLPEVSVPEWAGCLGLEPNPLMYVGHLVSIFRECRRVLRDDGVFWLNLASSYAANRGSGALSTGDKQKTNVGSLLGRLSVPNGFKPKDLIPIPWMVAMALQADGWYLRSDCIWAKGLSFAAHTTTCGHCGKKHEARYSGSCMPESCQDRPTKGHEYVFLLSKSPRYYYDQEAIREPNAESGLKRLESPTPAVFGGTNKHAGYGTRLASGKEWTDAKGGRNVRTVWAINPASFKEAHFATFPPALISPMIRASTSERGVCSSCGAPWERVTETSYEETRPGTESKYFGEDGKDKIRGDNSGHLKHRTVAKSTTIAWRPTCQCNAGETVPATVMDIFWGAGTTSLVCERLGRDSIGIELNPEYVQMGVNRCYGDAPLFTRVKVVEK